MKSRDQDVQLRDVECSRYVYPELMLLEGNYLLEVGNARLILQIAFLKHNYHFTSKRLGDILYR
jgi:hypothetical protein